MVERNKVRIRCNPYSKEILYHLWDSEDDIWCEMSENSVLTRSDFMKATIQNKAQDILSAINETYNLGNVGIDIVFEGTDDDFNELDHVRECYFRSFDIRCIKGETFVAPAADVIQDIDELFKQIDSSFEQYQDKEIKDLIAKFHDATRKVIPICVMGLYSSGKSAFLNSIIGEEILPSSTDPTTAKNYRISSGNKYEITFRFGDKPNDEARDAISLRFSEEDYSPYPNDMAKFPILSELQKTILDENADASPQSRMYRAISIINDYDKGKSVQLVSDLIDITVPFNKSPLPLDRYNFVFYDTPGSDSKSNEKHKKVLEDALLGQTNGLPIFITTPDSMDKDSNSKLIESIDSFASALDLTNTMVVVNRSDSVADSDLERKRDDDDQLILKSWKSTRIYFVSAVMGIGSKKNEPQKKSSWTDDTYRKIYKNNYEDFFDPKSDDYRRLYRFNIMPQHRYDAYCHDASAMEESPTSTVSQRIHYNSGIHCVESEIVEFSQRYALYSKCSNAKDYLTRAISQIQDKISNIEVDLKQKSDEVQQKLDDKSSELLLTLKGKSDALYKAYSADYRQPLQNLQAEFSGSSDTNWIKAEWAKTKKEKKPKDRISAISSSVKAHFAARTGEYAKKATQVTRDYWGEKTQDFKNQCIRIVTQSLSLSNEHKEFLSQYILTVSPMHISDFSQSRDSVWGVVPRHFLFFKIGEKFDVDKCVSEFVKSLKTIISATSTDAQQTYNKAFEGWGNDLLHGLEAKMAEFNPDLKAYSNDIANYQRQIDELRKQQYFITEKIDDIDALMAFREVNVNE